MERNNSFFFFQKISHRPKSSLERGSTRPVTANVEAIEETDETVPEPEPEPVETPKPEDIPRVEVTVCNHTYDLIDVQWYCNVNVVILMMPDIPYLRLNNKNAHTGVHFIV